MKKKKVIISTIISVIIIGACLSTIGFKILEKNLNQLAGSKITNVELSKVSDGIYTGGFEAFPVAAEVKLTVKNHRITGIELIKHKNGRGASAEIISNKVIEAQTLEVDTVSGATYSSKVILKAIQNALNSVNK